jgi:hypothetical protein
MNIVCILFFILILILFYNIRKSEEAFSFEPYNSDCKIVKLSCNDPRHKSEIRRLAERFDNIHLKFALYPWLEKCELSPNIINYVSVKDDGEPCGWMTVERINYFDEYEIILLATRTQTKCYNECISVSDPSFTGTGSSLINALKKDVPVGTTIRVNSVESARKFYEKQGFVEGRDEYHVWIK